jgi:hypothetical protein
MNKYFKKYGYYFFALFSLLLKNYKQAIQFFSEVMRYDFFLYSASEKYIKAIAKCKKTKVFVIRGGVGDILQSVPFMMQNKSRNYLVITHFPEAKEFFEKINLPIKNFCFYSSAAEYKKHADSLYKSHDILISPRTLFFANNPFLCKAKLFNNANPVVGVHLGASAIESNKTLPVGVLKAISESLSSEFYNILVFCREFELAEFRAKGLHETERLKFFCNPDITVSLELVSTCNYFVGSDSAFKTMASMLRIPTFVLFQNTKNGFRDRTFINPYVSQGIMVAFKYSRIDDETIRKIVSDISQRVKRDFLK